MTRTLEDVAPGSVWVRRVGDHAGMRRRVNRVTSGRVYFLELGGGANTGNGKVKRTEISCPVREFLAAHEPYNGSTNGGTHYRRPPAEPKPKPSEPDALSRYKPTTGIIDTGGSRLNIEVLTITPSMAAGWLERGGKNRRLSERRVAALAAAIRRGEWQLTGEAIKLDADGAVRDGQHRLAAIAQANVPVQSLVVRGVDEQAFDVMDSGRPRSQADILGLHGYASGAAMAAAARNLIFIENFGTVNPGQRDATSLISSVSTLKYLEDHPEVLSGVHMGDRIRSAGLQGGTGLWGAIATLWYRIDPAKAEEFTAMLVTGAGLEGGHPALALRNRMIKKEFGNGGKDKEAIAALAIKAWNIWRSGRSVPRYLHWHVAKSEAFPTAS